MSSFILKQIRFWHLARIAQIVIGALIGIWIAQHTMVGRDFTAAETQHQRIAYDLQNDDAPRLVRAV